MATGDTYGGLGFALGSVTGARAFMVNPDGWLTGLYYKQIWTPGENIAMCRKRATMTSPYGMARTAGPVDDNAPAPPIERGHLAQCLCGFHGFYEGSNDYNTVKNPRTMHISGMVEGYGECIIGSRGFRCVKARIIAIQITPAVGAVFDKVIRNYASIPMFSTFADMVAEFPPNNGNDVIEQLPDLIDPGQLLGEL